MSNDKHLETAYDLLNTLKTTLFWCRQDATNDDGYPTQDMFDARVETLNNAIKKAEDKLK